MPIDCPPLRLSTDGSKGGVITHGRSTATLRHITSLDPEDIMASEGKGKCDLSGGSTPLHYNRVPLLHPTLDLPPLNSGGGIPAYNHRFTRVPEVLYKMNLLPGCCCYPTAYRGEKYDD